jgi:hypothetical protein
MNLRRVLTATILLALAAVAAFFWLHRGAPEELRSLPPPS